MPCNGKVKDGDGCPCVIPNNFLDDAKKERIKEWKEKNPGVDEPPDDDEAAYAQLHRRNRSDIVHYVEKVGWVCSEKNCHHTINVHPLAGSKRGRENTTPERSEDKIARTYTVEIVWLYRGDVVPFFPRDDVTVAVGDREERPYIYHVSGESGAGKSVYAALQLPSELKHFQPNVVLRCWLHPNAPTAAEHLESDAGDDKEKRNKLARRVFREMVRLAVSRQLDVEGDGSPTHSKKLVFVIDEYQNDLALYRGLSASHKTLEADVEESHGFTSLVLVFAGLTPPKLEDDPHVNVASAAIPVCSIQMPNTGSAFQQLVRHIPDDAPLIRLEWKRSKYEEWSVNVKALSAICGSNYAGAVRLLDHLSDAKKLSGAPFAVRDEDNAHLSVALEKTIDQLSGRNGITQIADTGALQKFYDEVVKATIPVENCGLEERFKTPKALDRLERRGLLQRVGDSATISGLYFLFLAQEKISGINIKPLKMGFADFELLTAYWIRDRVRALSAIFGSGTKVSLRKLLPPSAQVSDVVEPLLDSVTFMLPCQRIDVFRASTQDHERRVNSVTINTVKTPYYADVVLQLDGITLLFQNKFAGGGVEDGGQPHSIGWSGARDTIPYEYAKTGFDVGVYSHLPEKMVRTLNDDYAGQRELTKKLAPEGTTAVFVLLTTKPVEKQLRCTMPGEKRSQNHDMKCQGFTACIAREEVMGAMHPHSHALHKSFFADGAATAAPSGEDADATLRMERPKKKDRQT